MDQVLHIDMRFGFDDNDFDLGNQTLSCVSSCAGSFSTASSACDPFTPPSGRSTPQQHTTALGYDPITCSSSMAYELTPPASGLPECFSMEIKQEYPHQLLNSGDSATPSQKSVLPDASIDFDYTNFLGSTLPCPGIPTETATAQPIEHYPPIAEQVSSSAFGIAEPQFSMSNPTCDPSPVWPIQGEGPVMFFNRFDATNVPTPPCHIPTRERGATSHPQSYLRSNTKRRLRLDNAKQKTVALQSAQDGVRHHAKRESHGPDESSERFVRIPPGTFKCDHPECVGKKKAFKRSEHLKRHKDTTHKKGSEVACEFCHKKFNRKDNWMQHLSLHCENSRAMKRTPYFPAAQDRLDAEKKRIKHRKPSKKKAAPKKELSS